VKTLHITNAWHASSGGISTFYRALFDTANRQGHAMRLVVPGVHTHTEDVGEYGRIYYIRAPLAPLNWNYRILYPYRFLFPNTAIQRIINSEKPDLVEISEKYSLPCLAGLLRRGRLPGVRLRPVMVGSSHERMDENMAAYVSRGRAAQRFCEWYMKWMYFPMFDHHITMSEHTAEELIRASRGHRVRRGIWVNPMGVDCKTFTPALRSATRRAELLQEAGGHASTTMLVYAGRLSPEKNVTLLIDLMERLKGGDYRLVIAGSGIQQEQLVRECAARNLNNVFFAGYIQDRADLARLFANADVFVHPNPREPFGIAPLEAMAAGLVVVAPNSGGVTTYANASNAWLVEATADAFAGAVREIREHPAARAEKTRRALETARAFDWPEITGRFLELYKELAWITRGERRAPSIAPRTYSTPGDLLGREIAVTR
jgi:alpha-1,6-mannosyltransferase